MSRGSAAASQVSQRILGRLSWLAVFSVLAVVLGLQHPTLAHDNLPLNDRLPEFTLECVCGVSHSSFELMEKAQALAVVFMSDDCATAQVYEDRLSRLLEQFRDKGLAIVAISLDTSDEPVDRFFENVKARDLPFHYLRDSPDYRTARLFGVDAVPQAFLFGGSGRLVYTGRIDDHTIEGHVERHYLKDAITAAIANEAPEVQWVPNHGCPVKHPKALLELAPDLLPSVTHVAIILILVLVTRKVAFVVQGGEFLVSWWMALLFAALFYVGRVVWVVFSDALELAQLAPASGVISSTVSFLGSICVLVTVGYLWNHWIHRKKVNYNSPPRNKLPGRGTDWAIGLTTAYALLIAASIYDSFGTSRVRSVLIFEVLVNVVLLVLLGQALKKFVDSSKRSHPVYRKSGIAFHLRRSTSFGARIGFVLFAFAQLPYLLVALDLNPHLISDDLHKRLEYDAIVSAYYATLMILKVYCGMIVPLIAIHALPRRR